MRGEPLAPAHEAELAALMLDPRVHRSLWAGPEPPTLSDVRAGLRDGSEHWDQHGFGLWLLRDRETGELAGRGGLEYTQAGGDLAVEVAWAIVPERWGRGLATELARAAVRVGFETLGLTELIAITLPDNLASRRVMEKVGFAYERRILHAGLDHVLCRLRLTGGTPPGVATRRASAGSSVSRAAGRKRLAGK